MADEAAAATELALARASAVATDPSVPMVNRRRRGIVGGAILIAVGIPYLLSAAGVPDATSYLFICLGLAFAVAYVTGLNPYVYLVPAAVLISFGIGLLIPGWFGLGRDTIAPIFLASLTIGFTGVFVMRPTRRWPMIPAAVFAVVALFEVFKIASIVPVALQPLFVPSILIAVGLYLIFAPRL